MLWSALKIADFSARHSNDPDKKTDPLNKTNTAPLEYLRSCTAVGTPFITYNNSPNSQKWLLLVEFSALLIEFIAPIIATVILFQFVGWWALFALTSIVFLVPLIEILTLPTKFAAQEGSSEPLEKQYGKHWLSIWSDDDEAINLLRTAIQARNKQFIFRPSLPIIPRAETSWLTKILFFGETLFWVYAEPCGLILTFLGSGGRNAATIFSLR